MKNRYSFLFLLVSLYLLACDNTNYKQGEMLYNTNCATCHMSDGSGVAKLYPPLVNFDTNRISIKNMPCIIRYGQDNSFSSLKMEGIKTLRDIEINNIINYILNDLNSIDKEFQIDDTREILQNCKEN